MAAYRRVYDLRHLQADCQEPGSAPEPYTLGSRVWATVNQHLPCVDTVRYLRVYFASSRKLKCSLDHAKLFLLFSKYGF